MPLWQLFVPENAYTPEEMKDFANRITDIYSGPESMKNWGFQFPRFFTSVVFHEFKPERFIVGGEPRDKFIQIEVVHIAGGEADDDRPPNEQAAERMGGLTEAEVFEKFYDVVNPTLKPYIEDRGYEWEIHIENAPAVSWRVDGQVVPRPPSEDWERWLKDDKASPRTFT
jgi:phenylpyruvate tautomerase PptA (4-oxalocrotonate tautomerase family)